MWEEIVRDVELLASTSAFVLWVRQSGDITAVYEIMRQVRLPWIGFCFEYLAAQLMGVRCRRTALQLTDPRI